MAAPDQLPKITNPVVTREPSIHGSSPMANAKIRRLHFVEGKGIKTICRDLKLSKKVIGTGIAEFTYTRTVQPRVSTHLNLLRLSR